MLPAVISLTITSAIVLRPCALLREQVAIVFVSTDSSEGSDRKSLSYDGNADDLVAGVAKAQKNTVVVGVNPGAALMPWASQVAAIFTAFMPGLEYVAWCCLSSLPALSLACLQSVQVLQPVTSWLDCCAG